MLLLVPSQKPSEAEQPPLGKQQQKRHTFGARSSRQILLVLPPQMDLSSTVIVSDTVITSIPNTTFPNGGNDHCQHDSHSVRQATVAGMATSSSWPDLSNSTTRPPHQHQYRPLHQPQHHHLPFQKDASQLWSQHLAFLEGFNAKSRGPSNGGCQDTTGGAFANRSSRSGSPYPITESSRMFREAFKKAMTVRSPILTSTSSGFMLDLTRGPELESCLRKATRSSGDNRWRDQSGPGGDKLKSGNMDDRDKYTHDSHDGNIYSARLQAVSQPDPDALLPSSSTLPASASSLSSSLSLPMLRHAWSQPDNDPEQVMTAHDISLMTASLGALTPLEIQRRIYSQQHLHVRRYSSTTSSSSLFATPTLSRRGRQVSGADDSSARKSSKRYHRWARRVMQEQHTCIRWIDRCPTTNTNININTNTFTIGFRLWGHRLPVSDFVKVEASAWAVQAQ
ncbi:hypothetical protein BGZ99_005651 [Dissophora globulifera]|uniref:Uncharacterized protein n=1 Tax=Dissophora globulifera TaxID=979702 RepID=A0A9P6RV41_9FUNG|nr:hypothetical protein BGZ99_005651 [Dissophora globulifera]